MWSNMWSKAILDQNRGEVKKKECQRCNGFTGWLSFEVQIVLQLPNQAPYQLGHTRIATTLYRKHGKKATVKSLFICVCF